jgi:signal transduction histidine kinase
MAVLQIASPAAEFERVQSLSRIAKILLDIRIVSCLLVAGWLSTVPGMMGMVFALVIASAWLLLVLLRWETVGLALCTHPVLLCFDALLCMWGLGVTEPVSPMLLLLGSGAVLTGLCLDRRGALFFTPVLVGGWWLVLSLKIPEHLNPGDPFVSLVLVPVLLVGGLFLGAGVRDVVLRSAEAERERRKQTRLAGVAEERARLAREMHDSLVKTLHGVAILADTLPAWLDRNPAKAKEQARTISNLIAGASTESRALILAMRRTHSTADVAEQVREAASRWTATTGRETEVHVLGDPELATESAYELVAILNEALENVDRHTPADTSATVTLSTKHNWVELTVADDGPGSELDLSAPGTVKTGHFGVVGMRERATRAGGRVTFDSAIGRGTTVAVRIPAQLPEDEEALS